MTARTRTSVILSILVGAAALLPAGASAAPEARTPAPPTRCTQPYDAASTMGAGQRTYRRSAPAIAWLRSVYGYEGDSVVRAGRRNVFRSVALRPCVLDRGAITVWTTNPPAMIRRAWKQPWIRDIDIQWVRVRFGGIDSILAVRRAMRPATRAALEEALGGSISTVGDDPSNDVIRLGIDADALTADADAIATRLLGVPVHVELQAPPTPT